MGSEPEPIRVLLCSTRLAVQAGVQGLAASWSELVVAQVVATPAEAELEAVDVAIVDHECMTGDDQALAPLVARGLSVIVVDSRAQLPSVVPLAYPAGERAVRLPHWALTRRDELTVAHLRTLIRDLAGRSVRRSTREFPALDALVDAAPKRGQTS